VSKEIVTLCGRHDAGDEQPDSHFGGNFGAFFKVYPVIFRWIRCCSCFGDLFYLRRAAFLVKSNTF
jgi:hypothetical protein